MDRPMQDGEDAALAAGLAAVAAAPDNPDAHLALGRLYQQRQAFARATAALQRARALGSTNPGVAFHLAEIAIAAGAFLTAAEEYQTATRQIGGHVEWTFLTANAFWILGWPDKAMRLFRRLPQPLPDWWASVQHRTEALLATHRETVRTHLAALRAGQIALEPGRELLHALTGLGRLGPAARLAECLVAAHPRDPRLGEYRARLAVRIGGPAAGLAVIEASIADGVSVNLELANRLALEVGDPDRALHLLASQPQANWSHGAWTQACRLRIVTEDSSGLVALAREWEEKSAGFDSTPYQFVLEGMRLGHRLPLLSMDVPAGPLPEAGLLHFWDAPQPPADVVATLATWREHNPWLRQTILDLEGARAFILAEHGEDALRCFDLCHHAAMKSDYLRLLWLVSHGGLYADTDEVCMGSVAPLFAALAESEVVVVLAGHSPPYLNNCVLGAARGSPLLAAAAREVTTRMLAAAAQGRRLTIWGDTGPGLLTRHVARALGQAGTPAEARRVASIIPELSAFARNDPQLAYKRTVTGNWRLA